MEYKDEYLQLAKNAKKIKELIEVTGLTQQQIIALATEPDENGKLLHEEFYLEVKRIVEYKSNAGRPVLYKTAEELQVIIDEYFDYCDNRAKKIINKDGQEYMIIDPAPYTMSGLARRLGMDRDTLLRYSKKEEFYGTIREARDKVQEDVENRMMETKNEKGAMFSLKNNFGWKDKSEVEEKHSGNITINKTSYK